MIVAVHVHVLCILPERAKHFPTQMEWYNGELSFSRVSVGLAWLVRTSFLQKDTVRTNASAHRFHAPLVFPLLRHGSSHRGVWI